MMATGDAHAEDKENAFESREARKREVVDQMTAKADVVRKEAERAAMLEPKGRLFHACEIGDSERVYLLLKKAAEGDQSIFSDESVGALVEASTPDGVTPLFTACKSGHVECAQLLLNAGAFPNKATKTHKFTPLWIACQKGKDQCVKLLLQQSKVNVNQPAIDGRTPLYAACEGGRPACVKLLIEAGAKLEERRNDGSTPLIVASVFGHADVVELLLEAGAKLKPSDEDGNALENARKQVNAGDRERVIRLLEAAFEERGHRESVQLVSNDVQLD